MAPTTQDVSTTLVGGVRMPLLGFGTWELSGREAYDSVRRALDVGYRHFDTATGYGNEAQVGRALRDSGVDRDEVFLTTKLPPDRAGKERETLEESLQDLGTGYVDLWLVHWPPNGEATPSVWREIVRLRDEGWARAAGVSNYSTAQVDELIERTGQTPAVNQVRWSPREHDPRRLRELTARGVQLEGYSPFKASRLSDPVLVDIAAQHGVLPSQVVLRWHVEHDIVVIPRSANPERIATNADIFGFGLDRAEMARIDALSTL